MISNQFDRIPEPVRDALSILTLVALNPLIYLHGYSVMALLPDSIGYIALGRYMLSDAGLFLPGWLHVDTGLILSPVYPALIAIGRVVLEDGPRVAEYVSSTCLVLATVPLFVYAARATNRIVAVIALALVQLSFYYYFYGVAALSEATFILWLSVGLWLASRYFTASGRARAPAILLGVTAGLVLLTRQIGVVFLLTVLGVELARWWIARRNAHPFDRIGSAFVLVGLLIPVVPYSVGLYAQTGQTMLVQAFRMGDYTVAGRPAEIESAMESALIERGMDPYVAKYQTRREMRRLVPDGSEMFAYLVDTSEARPAIVRVAGRTLSHPDELWGNLLANVRHLERALGLIACILLALTCLTALGYRRSDPGYWARAFLACFLIAYFAALTVLTGLVERYVDVLFALMSVHIVCEAYRVLHGPAYPSGWEKFRPVVVALVLLTLAVSTPRYFFHADPLPKASEKMNLAECASEVAPNEPVFALHPFYAYLLGGVPRTIPNDSLLRVAQYAQVTGVRWLVLDYDERTRSDRELYSLGQWLSDRTIPGKHPELLVTRCETANGKLRLYEIVSP